MQVIKRNGTLEPVDVTKIMRRIRSMCQFLNSEHVDAEQVAYKVMGGLHDKVKTSQLDDLAAETAAFMATEHPDYARLAGNIAISNLHKMTSESILETCEELFEYKDDQMEPSPLISAEMFVFVQKHHRILQEAIQYQRDYDFDYFGFKTLQRGYLLKTSRGIVERPQQMFLRVAIGIHAPDLANVLSTYDMMSRKLFIHATPTMFNAGTPQPQMSSCFLVAMKADSMEGIYDTLKDCALISRGAGGIGLHIHNVRAKGTYIKGTNGFSNGIIPMLRVFCTTARYVDQGGGKRKGSFAIYLEPWHADIHDWLQLRKNGGTEEMRARDLFYALWIPDLFMKRVKEDGKWSLFCPHTAPGLDECWGEKFEALYMKYEAQEGLARSVISARDLWWEILDAQMETGTPYLLYKDACNRKSNQQHLGTIKSSNLCTEIIQFSSPEETAVCNLASISLPQMYDKATKSVNFSLLHSVAATLTMNLNRVIDKNAYPTPESKTSNMKHRPIGIGVQGLADLFLLLRMPFQSEEAQQLNREIFETIYHGALCQSLEEAKQLGPHDSFEGSPASEGKLQFDFWDVTPSSRWTWDTLKKDIMKYGLRNSLLVAPMPTASTAQILGNNECFEPYTTNLYTRRVLAGEFPIVNAHLVKDLLKLHLWTPEIRNQLIAHNGSVQNIPQIPDTIKNLYKTAWEMPQKIQIDMAAARAPFIDQSQSFNVFMAQPDHTKLGALHFYSWASGLKTGMYYLRTQPAADAIKFTVDQQQLKEATNDMKTCSLEKKEGCESCGS